MPKYRIALANGKSMVFEGDEPPTDEQVESAAQEMGIPVTLLMNPKPQSPNQLNDWANDQPGTIAASKFELGAQQEAAMPTLRAAGMMAGPQIFSGLSAIAPTAGRLAMRVMENPLVGGGVGAYTGYKTGGVPGAIAGGVTGMLGANTLGKANKTLDAVTRAANATAAGATKTAAPLLAKPGPEAVASLLAKEIDPREILTLERAARMNQLQHEVRAVRR